MSTRREIGQSAGARWIDIVSPTKKELDSLAKEFNINSPMLSACLDPEHLPKFENTETGDFAILRLYDEKSKPESDTTQNLTRKVALFLSETLLITIHRSPLRVVEAVVDKWNASEISKKEMALITHDLFVGALNSFEAPIDVALDNLEKLEMSIFGAEGADPFEIQNGYLLKRKAFVFKRMLRLMSDISTQVAVLGKPGSSLRQSLVDQFANSLYFCEELSENTSALLNIHISLASQKTNESAQQTNEVIRVLTVFSMFLLPLNVITGIYGMNFENMPELKWTYGYGIALTLMFGVVISIFLWFRSKGWLKP